MGAVRSLYLLRHAKSSWADTGLGDHARPLSPRGEAAARAMAAYLRGEEVEPALVLCSTALRARQTLAALSPRGEVRYEDGLYGASAADLLARLRRVPDEVGSAMVVGHNPGLHELAVSCSGKGDPLQLARLGDKLPTGALVRLSFPGPWAVLAPGHAVLDALVVPADL
ncbi:MAG: SixA phosphatase family protein [Acidimicrobiales bacterium]